MRGSYIYNKQTENSDMDFLVVCDKHTTFPKEFYKMKESTNYGRRFDFHIKVDDYDFMFKTNEEWFQDVLDGSILGWECACLNKKFVIKEHVKLLMKTEPLKLRKQILLMDKRIIPENFNIKDAWQVIIYCKFANQIIENHKIVNYSVANDEWKKLSESDDQYNCYQELLQQPLNLLKKYTDGMLKKEIEQKLSKT